MASDTDFQLVCLFSDADLSLFQFTPPPLVLFQWKHRSQIGIGQSFRLLRQADTSLAQILPTSLELLRKPLPSLSSLQRLCNRLRMCEHFTEILPDQFVELPGRNEARATFLITTRNDRMALARVRV